MWSMGAKTETDTSSDWAECLYSPLWDKLFLAHAWNSKIESITVENFRNTSEKWTVEDATFDLWG